MKSVLSEALRLSLDLGVNNPLKEQLEEQGIVVKSEKIAAELANYDVLVRTLDYAYLQDVATIQEVEKIKKRIKGRVVDIASDYYEMKKELEGIDA